MLVEIEIPDHTLRGRSFHRVELKKRPEEVDVLWMGLKHELIEVFSGHSGETDFARIGKGRKLLINL